MSLDPSDTPRDLQTASRLIDAARRFDETIQTANLPVYRASTVLFDSLEQAAATGKATVAGELHRSTYGTAGTPTTYALMDALAEIEGAGADCRAALMPSGLAAISVPLLAFLSPGQRMLMSDSVYGPARAFAEGMLTRMGIETVFYRPTISAEELEAMITPNTRVLYLESPGSYTFELQDVPALTAVARRHDMLSIIDNAWASPVFARPFDWGVDMSLLPLTKYWSGHSDVLMGAVTIRSELWPTLWQAVRQLGICVGGDDAFLILRGMRTADVRMRRHEINALAVAEWLAGRSEVARVLHPALPSHPQHEIFKRDFSGSSGLFSFELAPGVAPAAVSALCEGRRHFGIGYSWGGYESLIMPANIRRTIEPWTGGQLIRLHIGLEAVDDLIADLDAGFEAMRRVSSQI
ncbi:MAG: cystathionine beta-lyase [Burkholderiaceae bacterium]